MAIQVYSTLERKKLPFTPRNEGKVSIYSCGITPYDATHLGHARQYVIWDVFRRYLEWKGYHVDYVQNFTDVDDKIIAKANAEGVKPADIANRYIDEYMEVMETLGVKPADVYPRVTEHIGEIIDLVKSLVERNLAYVVEGDVYFDVSAHEGYGKLSGRSLEDMEAGARVDVDERKADPMDFALWKSAKPGEPSWESPWGPGRPGWHIECSAMALKYLGPGFDMHGGGMDLIFPHHENEIAQAEGGSGEQFARYWMHHGYINVNSQKMSKSLGNFTSVKGMLQEHHPMAVRLYLISLHYRNPMNFSTDEITQARKSLDRLAGGYKTLAHLAEAAKNAGSNSVGESSIDVNSVLSEASATARAKFEQAMDDDFNTALALAALYDLVRAVNKVAALPEIKAGGVVVGAIGTYQTMTELIGVFGLDLNSVTEEKAKDTTVARENLQLLDDVMSLLLEVRKEARAAKNWAMSDQIRDGLKNLGILVEDTPEGARWRRVDV